MTMNDSDVGKFWDGNAEAWATLARKGYDVYRDYVNSPAFFEMLPDVSGLRGLDVGCGEGHNTRLAAERGAAMTALDISPKFIEYAKQAEAEAPLGIRYMQASALRLPFLDEDFDFAMATMSMMDMPQQERAVREVFRVLKPGGFFQFSITHPCFQTPKWQWIFDDDGNRTGVICGDYFANREGVDEWTFGAAPVELRERFPRFRVPRFDRTLSTWLNMLIGTGFVLEEFCEPHASELIARQQPAVADTRIVAYFLIIRCRKPA